MHKRIIIAVLAFIAFPLGLMAGSAPDPIARVYEMVKEKINQPASGLRVRISRIPRDVNLDPYPTSANFATAAGIVASLNVDYCREDTLKNLRALKELSWNMDRSLQGYAPLRIEILTVSDERLLDMFIDEKDSNVRIGNDWYSTKSNGLRRAVNEWIMLSNACLEGKHVTR